MHAWKHLRACPYFQSQPLLLNIQPTPEKHSLLIRPKSQARPYFTDDGGDMIINVGKVEDLETYPTDELDNLVWEIEAVNLANNTQEERWGQPDYGFDDNSGLDLETLLYEMSIENTCIKVDEFANSHD